MSDFEVEALTCIECGKYIMDEIPEIVQTMHLIDNIYFHKECRYGKYSCGATYDYLSLLTRLDIIKDEMAKHEKILSERLEDFKAKHHET